MLAEDALALYDEREEELGEELMRVLERYLILQIIDQRWREHLYDMDYLREGIHLRGFAQIEPLVAYKNEAFTLFEDLMNSIWADFARMIYNVEVEVQGPERAAAGARRSGRRRRSRPRATSARWSTRAERSRTSRRPTATREDGSPQEPPVVAQRRVAEHESDRSQRPVLVRLGQEVQEVPRSLK